MRRARSVAIAGVVIAGLATSVVASSDRADSGPPSWALGGGPRVAQGKAHGNAYWIRPASVRELYGDSDFVGVVRIEAIAAGEDLETPPSADVSANDVAPIPTQKISATVEKQWGGPRRRTIEIFKTGDQARWLEDDPPYAVGQVYIVAGKWREDGLLVPFGPEGRLEVRNGKTHSLTDSTVGRANDGRDSGDLVTSIESIRGGGKNG